MALVHDGPACLLDWKSERMRAETAQREKRERGMYRVVCRVASRMKWMSEGQTWREVVICYTGSWERPADAVDL